MGVTDINICGVRKRERHVRRKISTGSDSDRYRDRQAGRGILGQTETARDTRKRQTLVERDSQEDT